MARQAERVFNNCILSEWEWGEVRSFKAYEKTYTFVPNAPTHSGHS